MRTLLAVAIVAVVVAGGATVRFAHADVDASVAIAADGDATVRSQLVPQLESWLRGHGHKIGTQPSAAEINILLGCVGDDQCMRKTADRSKTSNVLLAKIDVARGGDITLTAWWLGHGRPPINVRRICEHCTQDAMKGTVDAVMTALAGSVSGRVKLRSDPAGMIVMLDNASIGATPLERDVSAGEHVITLTHGGVKVGERKITVKVGDLADILIPVTGADDAGDATPRDSAPLGPKIAVGGMILGGASLVAGTVMIVAGGDPKTSPRYRDFRTPGIGVAAFGGVVLGTALYLWFRGDHHDSAPVASVSRDGAYLGWTRAF